MVDMVNVVSATSGDFTRLLDFFLIITCFMKNAPKDPKKSQSKTQILKKCNLEKEGGRCAGLRAGVESPLGAECWSKGELGFKADGLRLPRGGFGDVGDGVGGAIRSG